MCACDVALHLSPLPLPVAVGLVAFHRFRPFFTTTATDTTRETE
jgi:hypothetical protein